MGIELREVSLLGDRLEIDECFNIIKDQGEVASVRDDL